MKIIYYFHESLVVTSSAKKTEWKSVEKHQGNISMQKLISSFLYLYSKKQEWWGTVQWTIVRVTMDFSCSLVDELDNIGQKYTHRSTR